MRVDFKARYIAGFFFAWRLLTVTRLQARATMAQSPGVHPANVTGRLDQDDRRALPCRRDCRTETARRGAVNDHVCLRSREAPVGGYGGQQD